MIIGLDKGHTITGAGTGASGNGYREEDLTRQLGDDVQRLLESLGHTVIDCTVDRASSTNEQLKLRVAKANKQKLDLFVSIHFNAFDKKASGVECYVYSKSSKAYKHAVDVCAGISKCGLKNRGVNTKDFYVLKHTNAPAMLLETCFIDNKGDIDVYKKQFKSISKAVAEGILGKTITIPDTNANKGKYRVICGSFTDKSLAEERQEYLKAKGIESFLVFTEGI